MTRRHQRDDLTLHPGDDVRTPAPKREGTGWTKAELMQVAGMSGKGFDALRKAARVKGPTHGGLKWVFDAQDLIALIQKAESGKFSTNGALAGPAWRQFLAEAGIVMPEVISRQRR